MNPAATFARVTKAMALTIILQSGTASAGIPYPLVGDVSCQWGSGSCDQCVFDVPANFAAISDNTTGHPALSFEACDDDPADLNCPGFQPEITNAAIHGRHIQGMGRLPVADGNPVFVFSRNTGLTEWDQPTGVFAGQLGDLVSGGGNLGTFTNSNDSANRAVSYITTDDDFGVTDLAPVDHYGGLQTLGQLVVVGGECQWDAYTCANAAPRVDIIDFSDPSAPVMINRVVVGDLGHDAGMVGAARLQNGHYYILLNFRFSYVSTTTDIESTEWQLVDDFTSGSPSFVDEMPDQSGWPNGMQNMNIVTECGTGALYVVATHSGAMNLFRLETDAINQLLVRKVGSRNMSCGVCSFEASGNTYVTREGNLALYATNKEENHATGDLIFEEFPSTINVCNDVIRLTDPAEDPTRQVDADCDYGSHIDDDQDGYTEDDGDCDDSWTLTYPGASEVLDGVDNDCDGLVDEDTLASDDDGDGFCEGVVDGDALFCTDGSAAGDCDDTNPVMSPATPEGYDGLDNDCDGIVDEGTIAFDDDGDSFTEIGGDCNDYDATSFPGAPELEDQLDNDCDGIADDGTNSFDDDGDGWSENELDCDDRSPETHPGAPEQVDGRDNDCDGLADEGTVAWDDDGDGFSENGGDCDDFDPSAWPGAPEILDDVDNDCDLLVDEGTVAYDDDSDGWSESDGDCDDRSPLTFPGAFEVPDQLDNDCDGVVDEGTTAGDDDGDGFSELEGDCDDSEPSIHPNASEFCDEVDSDCDGEGWDTHAEDAVSWYRDADRDGYGTATDVIHACQAPYADPSGWASVAGDCDDARPDIHPGAPEVEDGQDRDCDGRRAGGAYGCSTGGGHVTMTWLLIALSLGFRRRLGASFAVVVGLLGSGLAAASENADPEWQIDLASANSEFHEVAMQWGATRNEEGFRALLSRHLDQSSGRRGTAHRKAWDALLGARETEHVVAQKMERAARRLHEVSVVDEKHDALEMGLRHQMDSERRLVIATVDSSLDGLTRDELKSLRGWLRVWSEGDLAAWAEEDADVEELAAAENALHRHAELNGDLTGRIDRVLALARSAERVAGEHARAAWQLKQARMLLPSAQLDHAEASSNLQDAELTLSNAKRRVLEVEGAKLWTDELVEMLGSGSLEAERQAETLSQKYAGLLDRLWSLDQPVSSDAWCQVHAYGALTRSMANQPGPTNPMIPAVAAAGSCEGLVLPYLDLHPELWVVWLEATRATAGAPSTVEFGALNGGEWVVDGITVGFDSRARELRAGPHRVEVHSGMELVAFGLLELGPGERVVASVDGGRVRVDARPFVTHSDTAPNASKSDQVQDVSPAPADSAVSVGVGTGFLRALGHDFGVIGAVVSIERVGFEFMAIEADIDMQIPGEPFYLREYESTTLLSELSLLGRATLLPESVISPTIAAGVFFQPSVAVGPRVAGGVQVRADRSHVIDFVTSVQQYSVGSWGVGVAVRWRLMSLSVPSGRI